MRYNVNWDKEALNFLRKKDSFISKRIVSFVKEFSEDPRKKQFKKLKGEKSFRLRAGDYRILFDFEPNERTISILRIDHRKNIYKR